MEPIYPITPDDLLTNEHFLNYYFQKDEADTWEWSNFLEEHPDQQPVVDEAISILNRLSLKWSEAHIREMFIQFQRSLNENLNQPDARPNWFQKRTTWLMGAAASVLLAAGIWTYVHERSMQESMYMQQVSDKQLIEQSNTSTQPMRVQLPDGSIAMLGKNSRMSYPARFADNSREVYLDGEGFFDVIKNPKKPFLVHAHEVVTKVLGTSFTVKSATAQSKIEVVVKTGKVSVYRAPETSMPNASKQLQGVIVTPNQQLVYNRNADSFTRSIVDDPQLIHPEAGTNFEFRNTPSNTVFEKLQRAYGVPIEYNASIMGHCPVTASLADESLFKKLELVCRAIEAQYEVIDGQIVIVGKGCQ